MHYVYLFSKQDVPRCISGRSGSRSFEYRRKCVVVRTPEPHQKKIQQSNTTATYQYRPPRKGKLLYRIGLVIDCITSQHSEKTIETEGEVRRQRQYFLVPYCESGWNFCCYKGTTSIGERRRLGSRYTSVVEIRRTPTTETSTDAVAVVDCCCIFRNIDETTASRYSGYGQGSRLDDGRCPRERFRL